MCARVIGALLGSVLWATAPWMGGAVAHAQPADIQIEETGAGHYILIGDRSLYWNDRDVSSGEPTCVDATVCLYTNTPDDHFLVDTHPASDRILYASPCSGHGFKHSTALGEALVQQVTTGRSAIDLSPFARTRLG